MAEIDAVGEFMNDAIRSGLAAVSEGEFGLVDKADAIIQGFDDSVVPDGDSSNEAVEDDADYGVEEDVDDEVTGIQASCATAPRGAGRRCRTVSCYSRAHEPGVYSPGAHS